MSVPFLPRLSRVQLEQLHHRVAQREFWLHRMVSVYLQKKYEHRWQRSHRVLRRVVRARWAPKAEG